MLCDFAVLFLVCVCVWAFVIISVCLFALVVGVLLLTSWKFFFRSLQFSKWICHNQNEMQMKINWLYSVCQFTFFFFWWNKEKAAQMKIGVNLFYLYTILRIFDSWTTLHFFFLLNLKNYRNIAENVYLLFNLVLKCLRKPCTRMRFIMRFPLLS